VVEGATGPSGSPPGRFAYLGDANTLSDLQIQATQPLGDGSSDVPCSGGGVPAINPPVLDPATAMANTINDFSCSFLDGGGAPVARRRNEACVKFLPSEDYGFVGTDSSLQFCAFINNDLRFHEGNTLVTVQLRDEDGNVGAPAQLIVHVPATAGSN
jgi:hypothetical protein